MPNKSLDIGVVTDEVARDLAEALDICAAWGLSRFELREGSERRFPFFTAEEFRLVEEAVRRGNQITAVSPGIFKGHIEDENRLNREIEQVLPRAIEQAKRVEAPLLIVFGFARDEEASSSKRSQVMRAFERAAEEAAAAGMTVAVENEPDFWVDRPAETVALFDAIGHPALKANWDPANLHWGGSRPDHEAFRLLRPYIANLHVKDYIPDDPHVPWRPVGQGTTPWPDILAWIVGETDLMHATLETHCEPLEEKSRASLEAVRTILADIENRDHDR